jgi:hypothetical protein
VAQPAERHVKVFSIEGKRAGTIGRAGDGPGEFRSLAHIGWNGEDLYALDVAARHGRRIHWFSPDGMLRRTAVVPTVRFDSTTRTAQVIALLAGGGALLAPELTSMESDEDSLPILLADSSGRVLRKVTTLRRRRSSLTFEGAAMSVRSIADSIEDAPIVVVAPDGSWFAVVERGAAPSAEEHSYVVTRLTPTGTEQWRRVTDYVPQRLPPSLADRLVDHYVQLYTRGRPGVSQSAARAFVTDIMNPIEFHPPVRAARAGVDGTIWILEAEQTGDSNSWIVLDREGRHTRSVHVPGTSQVRVAGPTFLIATRLDSLDVPIIERYLIEPPRNR